MSKLDSGRMDELLDWLADEVAARLAPSRAAPAEAPAGPATPTADPAFPTAGFAAPPETFAPAAAPIDLPDDLAPLEVAEPASALNTHAAALMSRLALGLVAALVLINLPLFSHGAALARMVPNATSLVIRNGLLVRESGQPDVYVYQDGKFRWITDLGAFQHYGYRWENVHEVAAGFLADFEKGGPVSVLAKCDESPHVYRLENGAKHWIVDIPTFEAEGYSWSDIIFMSCEALRALPSGETIPPGRGPSPQP